MGALTPFSQAVIDLVSEIPAGRVSSYGRIAAAAGNPRGARQVARLLHSCSTKYQLPWHRVVNHRGVIALKDDVGSHEQSLRLRLEGVEVSDSGAIDLAIFEWRPSLNPQ